MMPKLDGWSLVRALRPRPELALVPVIFLTALGGEEDRIRGFRLGADDYLPKPFRFEELDLRVANALKKAQARTPPPEARSRSRAAPHAEPPPTARRAAAEAGRHPRHARAARPLVAAGDPRDGAQERHPARSRRGATGRIFAARAASSPRASTATRARRRAQGRRGGLPHAHLGRRPVRLLRRRRRHGRRSASRPPRTSSWKARASSTKASASHNANHLEPERCLTGDGRPATGDRKCDARSIGIAASGSARRDEDRRESVARSLRRWSCRSGRVCDATCRPDTSRGSARMRRTIELQAQAIGRQCPHPSERMSDLQTRLQFPASGFRSPVPCSWRIIGIPRRKLLAIAPK